MKALYCFSDQSSTIRFSLVSVTLLTKSKGLMPSCETQSHLHRKSFLVHPNLQASRHSFQSIPLFFAISLPKFFPKNQSKSGFIARVYASRHFLILRLAMSLLSYPDSLSAISLMMRSYTTLKGRLQVQKSKNVYL